jgi:XTP/dITP diphosphohydrolase
MSLPFSTLVLASSNAGKIAELSDLLAPLGVVVQPQTDFAVPDADETGLSFIENAILKARHAARLTGLPAVADDSGLAVNALGGAPGIYSARFAAMHHHKPELAKDEANIDLLLAQMANQADRRAAFYCVLAFVRHADDPVPLIAQGCWQGEIAGQTCGDGGFGYDPVFYLPALQCTAAQLSKTDKATLSHRGQALRQLVSQLDLL